MASSLLVANALLLLSDVPFPFSLAIVVAVSVPTALAVTLLTSPESPEQLAAFYARVRPPGWWGPVAARAGLPAERIGAGPWLRVGFATAGVYGILLGAGGLLLDRPGVAVLAMAAGLAALAASIFARRSAS